MTEHSASPDGVEPAHPAPGAVPAAEVQPPARPDAHPARRLGLRLVLPLLAMLLLVGALAFVLIPGSSKARLPGAVAQTAASNGYRGAVASPSRAAPSTDLPNYLGHRVSLSQYRGKALLVTFLYTHCPDVCPLITANLRVMQGQLGTRASRVQIVAISVDPRGDTPRAVGGFLRAHDMTGRMQYLVGSARQLGPVWASWYVGTQRDAGHPELVAHSAFVYGITASGRLATLYPANFSPADMAHDVPLLAAR